MSTLSEFPQPTLESTGAGIRARRKRMGYTQQELADLAGVGRWDVARLEKGISVGWDKAHSVLRALDVFLPNVVVIDMVAP